MQNHKLPQELRIAMRRIALTLLAAVAGTPVGAVGTVAPTVQDDPQRLPVFREVHRIGVLDGDSPYLLGAVRSLTADAGREVVVVLDASDHRIAAFTFTGEFVAEAGGFGEGPGELKSPNAILAADSHVHVVDFGTNRINRFVWEADSLRYAGYTRSAVMGATNLCRIDGDYFVAEYVLGDPEQRFIHRFGDSSEVTSSFGQPFLTGDEIMSAATDQSRFVCDPERGALYVLSHAVPRVRGYSAGGALLWETDLPDVESVHIEREPDGDILWRPPEGRTTTDRCLPLSIVPGGEHLLVQCQVGVWGQKTDPGAPARSFMIDAGNGEILAETRDIPRIDLFAGGFAFSSREYPFPQIVVYEWRWGRADRKGAREGGGGGLSRRTRPFKAGPRGLST